MSIALRISLLIGILFYLSFILLFLRQKKMTLKYSLLWLLSAVVLLIMAVFPRVTAWFTHLLGIEMAVNAVFLAFVFFILLLLISMTAIVSKQHREIKILIQHISILEKKVDDLIKNPDSKG